MANYDQLTGMPNKTLFTGFLEESLARAKKKNRTLGLLMLDLDGYGIINQRFGHDAGNLLIHTMAERLRNSVSEKDKAAYFGGDTFAVALVDPKDMAAVVLSAEKIRKNLSAPLPLNGEECRVGVSVGIAVFPDNGTELDRLLTVADSAMFESKTSGKNTSTVYKGLTREHADIIPLVVLQEFDSVGIPEIDEQHDKLATLINQLHVSLKNSPKENRHHTKVLYDELVEFTEFHFGTEARLMHAAGYPEAEAHNRAHKFLLDELRYLKVRIIDGEELHAFKILKDWLIVHIEKDDKPMGHFLQNKTHSS
jgi:diguanylate cyclase (GGDEF)-like protein/hemerythrin-like metal-binding protein